MGRAVFFTAVPRTTPSVGFMAIARTVESPTCWATSHTMVSVSSSSVRSSSSAKEISGSSSGGNSTSTTGPITRTTRPSSLVPSLTACAICSPPYFLECFSGSHDLHDLGGDLGLAGLVGLACQRLDEVLGVLGGSAHRAAPRGVLGRRGLEQRGEHARLHVPGDQSFEDLLRARFEDVERLRPLHLLLDLLHHERNEAMRRGSLGESANELRVHRVDLVHLALRERFNHGVGDLLRVVVAGALGEPGPDLLHRTLAEPEVGLPLAAGDVELRLLALVPE